MDTVILAAGKGARLNGIMAPFHKPLLVVDGKPLIRRSVEAAWSAGSRNIVVVAAPENAAAISHVLEGAGMGFVDIILQRTPLGPGHALMQGLKLVKSSTALVIMGDNLVSSDDVSTVAQCESHNAVGISWHSADDAERFTWYDRSQDTWVEKTKPSDNRVPCWVGPIKISTREFTAAYSAWQQSGVKGEVPIGPLFNNLPSVCVVDVSSIDVGTPEAIV